MVPTLFTILNSGTDNTDFCDCIRDIISETTILSLKFVPAVSNCLCNNKIVFINASAKLASGTGTIVKFTPIFFTSEQSGELKGSYNLSPDPQQNPFIRMFNKSNQILGARTEFTNASGFLNQVILVSDSEFMADNGGGRSPENHIFILNSIDYLIGDQDLIALRSREITSRPLQDISDTSKRTWKWLNISTPSLLIIGFGLVRIRRQKNRSSILEELYG